jgi:hypothetical protein
MELVLANDISLCSDKDNHDKALLWQPVSRGSHSQSMFGAFEAVQLVKMMVKGISRNLIESSGLITPR